MLLVECLFGVLVLEELQLCLSEAASEPDIPNAVSPGLFFSTVKQHADNLIFTVEGKYVWSCI